MTTGYTTLLSFNLQRNYYIVTIHYSSSENLEKVLLWGCFKIHVLSTCSTHGCYISTKSCISKPPATGSFRGLKSAQGNLEHLKNLEIRDYVSAGPVSDSPREYLCRLRCGSCSARRTPNSAASLPAPSATE